MRPEGKKNRSARRKWRKDAEDFTKGRNKTEAAAGRFAHIAGKVKHLTRKQLKALKELERCV